MAAAECRQGERIPGVLCGGFFGGRGSGSYHFLVGEAFRGGRFWTGVRTQSREMLICSGTKRCGEVSKAFRGGRFWTGVRTQPREIYDCGGTTR